MLGKEDIIFDEEILVMDEKTMNEHSKINAYLWATYGLMEKAGLDGDCVKALKNIDPEILFNFYFECSPDATNQCVFVEISNGVILSEDENKKMMEIIPSKCYNLNLEDSEMQCVFESFMEYAKETDALDLLNVTDQESVLSECYYDR